MSTTTIGPASGRTVNRAEIVAQIGGRTVAAISGGRVQATENGIRLPVRYGYAVTVDLEADDTYTVRRTFTRAGKTTVKGERRDVYFTEVSEAAYAASCYVNREF